jgi:calpain-15
MKNPRIFVDDIDPNDIKQGYLPDCWFLSSLSSLAERPDLVRRLIITQEYNKEGIYKVRLCKNGEWVVITVDDYIPCYYNGGPMFSRGNGEELWVMLLEKAYAKMHGCYYSLRYGFTHHGMLDLTGCPTWSLKIPEDKPDYSAIEDFAEELWDKILDADEQGFLISGETPGFDTVTEGRTSIQVLSDYIRTNKQIPNIYTLNPHIPCLIKPV